MKKFTLFLAVLFLTFNLGKAQFTITASDMMQVGESLPIQIDTTTTVYNVGGSGTNQTWTMPALSSLVFNIKDTSRVVDPATTQWGNKFPNATGAVKTKDFVFYMNQTASALNFIGGGGSFAGISTYITYNPPMQVLSIPSTYQTNFINDNGFVKAMKASDINSTLGFLFDSVKIVHKSHRVENFDGWGTLTVDGYTFPNVMREMIVDYNQDSLYSMSKLPPKVWSPGISGVAPASTKDTTTSYNWYAEGYHSSVLSVEQKKGKTTRITLIQDLPVSRDNSINNFNTSLYPNPVKDNLFVKAELTGKVTYIIIDNLGRKLATGVIDDLQIGGSVSVNGLASGLYMLNIQTKKGVMSQKFVKE